MIERFNAWHKQAEIDGNPLAPARGIINGVLLAIPLWALILFIVWGVVK